MFRFDDLAWTAAALVIAGYLGAVLYQGNPLELINELSKEAGYVEFAIAGYILYLLVVNKQVGQITGPIVTLAVLAAVIQAMQSAAVQSAVTRYNRGELSLLGALMFATGSKLEGAK